jgi:hypothetical protein
MFALSLKIIKEPFEDGRPDICISWNKTSGWDNVVPMTVEMSPPQ